MSARGWWQRMSELWRKNAREQEMEEEFASLVEMETEAGIARGMTRDQARRAAQMKVGAETTKEQVRDQRGLPVLETLWQDVRYGWRTLRKSPAFAAVAIITIALGIGANTAMFSAIDAVLLKGLPFRDPARLVMVWEKNPELEGFLAERLPVRLQSYLYWKQHAQSFDGLSAALYDAVNVSGTDQPEHVERAAVTSDFLPVLGVTPALGRTFTPEENQRADANVAMISYAMYQARFGEARDVLGRDIEINGVPHKIVGVLPRGFYLSGMWAGFDRAKPEVWTPLNASASQPDEVVTQPELMVYGRLRNGVTLAQARSEIAVLQKQLVEQYPKVHSKKDGANVFTVYTEDVATDLRRSLFVLQLAVMFVLLLGCVNVANLLLARAEKRQREIAVRMALGASRGRVMRQMVSESVLLSVLGALPGLALAWAGTMLVSRLAPKDVRGLHEMTLDPTALAFTAGITVIAGVLFGLAPAFHVSGRNLHDRVNRGGRGGSGGMSRRFRRSLIVAEVALALAPLVGAGLMIRTLHAMSALDIGMQPQNVIDGRIDLPDLRYKKEQLLGFDNQVLDKAAAVPGVEAAALAGSPPLQSINYTGYHLDGEGELNEKTVDTEAVSDGYFRTMGTPILRGRDFTRAEAEKDADLVVVSETAARKVWASGDAIGKALIFGGRRRVVIGVVPDTRVLEVSTDARDTIYYPTRNLRNLTLMVRTKGDPRSVEGDLSAAIRSIDRTLPFYEVHTLESVLRESLNGQRFTMTLLMTFAGLALVLAAIGIYGVISYGVAQRTQEIGVRMAFGARASDVARMVLGQGLGAVGVGAAIGLVATLVMTRAMSGLLFGVRTYDPETFVAVVALLTVIGVIASYVPARRAAKVDPMEALRAE